MEEKDELITLFVELNGALDNLYSVYDFQIKNNENFSAYEYANNCIEKVEVALKKYEEEIPNNSIDKYLSEDQINKIRLNLKKAKKCLDELVSKK